MRQPPPQSRSSLFVPEAAARALRAGVASHQAGDLPRAAALYRQCLAACPNHVDALANLGSILRAQGQTAEALAMLQRACTLDPRHAGAYFNLANAFDATGQTASAIDTYRTLLDFQPDHAMAWYNLGLVLQTRGSLDEAAAAYRQAIAFNPGHREARLNLASVLSTCGQLSAARTELENLLAQVSDCGPALNNLASLAQDLGEHVRALSLLQHVSALAPELTQPRSNFLLGLQYHPAATPAELLHHARAWGEWASARAVGRASARHACPEPVEAVGINPDLQKHEDLCLKPDLQKREALRVGYVSADLCMHPVGLFLKEVIAEYRKLTSIALDGAGHPHIAYLQSSGSANLKYARSNGVAWSTQTVTTNLGSAPHLVMPRMFCSQPGTSSSTGSKLSALASSMVKVDLPTPIIPAMPIYPSANILFPLAFHFVLYPFYGQQHVVRVRGRLHYVVKLGEAGLMQLDQRLVKALHAVERALGNSRADAVHVVFGQHFFYCRDDRVGTAGIRCAAKYFGHSNSAL